MYIFFNTKSRKLKYNYKIIFTIVLTFTGPIPDEEKKLSQIFIFTLLCGASKGFMKAFIKPFEAAQRSVKIKIQLNFFSIQLSYLHGTRSVKLI